MSTDVEDKAAPYLWRRGLNIPCPACDADIGMCCDVSENKSATRPSGRSDGPWLHRIRIDAAQPQIADRTAYGRYRHPDAALAAAEEEVAKHPELKGRRVVVTRTVRISGAYEDVADQIARSLPEELTAHTGIDIHVSTSDYEPTP